MLTGVEKRRVEEAIARLDNRDLIDEVVSKAWDAGYAAASKKVPLKESLRAAQEANLYKEALVARAENSTFL